MDERRKESLYVTVITGLKPTMSSADRQAMLWGVRQGALERFKGTLVSDREILVEDAKRHCPGREFELTSPNGVRMSQRAIIAGERLYQIVYLRKAATDEPFQKLVASFSFM